MPTVDAFAWLLDNSAAGPRFLFKKGGALDLCFGTKWNPGNLQENNPYQEGDCRVLIAKVQGLPTALLYRPVFAGVDRKDGCVFESPIGKEVFASVTDITAAKVFRMDNRCPAPQDTALPVVVGFSWENLISCSDSAPAR